MNIGYNKKNSSLYFLDFIFYCKWLNIILNILYILDKLEKKLIH